MHHGHAGNREGGNCHWQCPLSTDYCRSKGKSRADIMLFYIRLRIRLIRFLYWNQLHPVSDDEQTNRHTLLLSVEYSALILFCASNSIFVLYWVVLYYTESESVHSITVCQWPERKSTAIIIIIKCIISL